MDYRTDEFTRAQLDIMKGTFMFYYKVYLASGAEHHRDEAYRLGKIYLEELKSRRAGKSVIGLDRTVTVSYCLDDIA